MKIYTKQDIYKTLKKIGLKKGDTIFVNPEFFRFGILKEAKNKRIFFNIYLNVIKKIIGATGTIAVNTYTFNTLRDKQSFIHEKSISTSSEFSEFVRKQRGSIRSNHPVFSVTALGKNRKKICSNNSLNNYGYNSPYHRLLKLNAKIINFGIPPVFNPILHHAEFLIGLPIYYNKLTKVKYFKKNKEIKKLYSSSVRYSYVDTIKCPKKAKLINSELIRKKITKYSNLGASKVYLTNSKKYFDLLIDKLSKNHFFLYPKNINYSFFKKNQYPVK